jgi:hypothetical protein
VTALPQDGPSALIAFARLFLAAVYAWSAGAKILWPGKFRELLAATGMLPGPLVEPAAIVLPVVELVLALAFLWSPSGVMPAAASAFLSLIFSGVHAFTWGVGEVVPRGCLGVTIRHTASGLHAAMPAPSLTLLGASLFLLLAPVMGGAAGRFPEHRLSAASPAPPRLHEGEGRKAAPQIPTTERRPAGRSRGPPARCCR